MMNMESRNIVMQPVDCEVQFDCLTPGIYRCSGSSSLPDHRAQHSQSGELSDGQPGQQCGGHGDLQQCGDRAEDHSPA